VPTTPRARRSRPTLALVLGTALAGFAVLTACGDDGGGGGGGNGGSGSEAARDADLQVLARDVEFDQDSYTLPAGTSAIAYVQEGAMVHTLLIEGPDGDDVADFELEVTEDGEVDVGEVTLEPGTYTLYCDVPGHRQAGMEAELVVKPAEPAA
jgi:plastocyanin